LKPVNPVNQKKQRVIGEVFASNRAIDR